MEREESKVSDICKKYVELMCEFYDKYHDLNNRYESLYQKAIKLDDERLEYKRKYDKLCKDIIDIKLNEIKK